MSLSSNKSYTNELVLSSINVRALKNDVNVFRILFENKKKKDYEYIDLNKYLNKHKENVRAVHWEKSGNNFSYCYVMTEKSFDIATLKSCFPSDISKNIYDYLLDYSIKNKVILNLVLIDIANSKKCDKDNILNNSQVYKLINSNVGSNQQITLKLEIKEKALSSMSDSLSLIFCISVATFTKYNALLSDYDKDSIHSYYKKSGLFMDKLPKKPEDMTDVFVLRNPWTRNNIKSFTYGDNSTDKLDTLYRIKEELVKTGYFQDLDFSEIHFEDVPKNELSALKKQFKEAQNRYMSFFVEHTLNVVYKKDLDLSKLPLLSQLKLRQVRAPEDGFNLVILDETEKGESEIDDLRYDTDYASNLICQHIGINTLFPNNDKKKKDKSKENEENSDKKKEDDGDVGAVIKKCLQELLIAKDLKDKKINLFDWTLCPDKDKKYKFYKTLKVEKESDNKNDEKEYEVYYGMLEINFNGDILNARCEKEDFFPGPCYLENTSMGAIQDSSFNTIVIENTEEFIVVNNKEYFKEIDKVSKNKMISFDGEEWCEMFEEILEDFPELSNDIISVIDEIKKKGICRDIKLSAIKKMISSQKIKKCMEKYLKDEKGLDVSIIKKVKSKSQFDTYYETFRGFHYNLKEAKYTACAKPDSPSKDLTNNVILKKFFTSGKNIFEELIPLFYVPFVYSDRLTVLPFPFKYLVEFMRHEIKRSKLTSPKDKTSSD